MGDLRSALDFLSWPAQVVNELRSVLAELNVPLHAVLAQLLAAVVLGAVGWYFLDPARNPKRSLARLAARSVLAAASIGILAIVAAWVDNAVVPRSHEIIGTIASGGARDIQVDLLDYRGESLGPQVDVDSRGAFVVRYTPAFADPPKALQIRATGCEERIQPLTRAHLLGTEITVQISCEAGVG